MIDKTEIECRFRRSVDSYEDNATVQKWIVQRLVELLQEYVPYSSRTDVYKRQIKSSLLR